MEALGIEEQVSIEVDDRELIVADDSDNEEAMSSNSNPFNSMGLFKLQEESADYMTIKNSFLLGLKPVQENIQVVSIYQNLHSNFTAQARIQSFRIFSEAVRNKCGGNPNIRYAWYGTSTAEIRQIVSHGFNLCGRHENFEAYGCGLQLSPANYSIVSALSAVSEQDGLRHVMLCRVILGNMEIVQPGSNQLYPSSMEFDSGVDDLSNPRRYIIWNASMNSHIIPNYVISFRPTINGKQTLLKCSMLYVVHIPNYVAFRFILLTGQGHIKMYPCIAGGKHVIGLHMRPQAAPSMSFGTLESVLSRVLSPTKLSLVKRWHSEFKLNLGSLTSFVAAIGDEPKLGLVIGLHFGPDLALTT
ncbi:Poly(ADP-ribose) polymerase, catalytic domain [Dillenia turbinata]|uniref:Poly [ADP-ribose] polymerase n=1 Tax=Dillenia turbinata TaxID=194707 RepID=A0AAN8V7J4_9MAGN